MRSILNSGLRFLKQCSVGNLNRKTNKQSDDINLPKMHSVQALSDEEFLKCLQIISVNDYLRVGDTGAAKRAVIEYYQNRHKPVWPKVTSCLTDLRLNLDAMGEQEIIEQAEQILNNSVTYSKIKPSLTPQGDINWFDNPAQNHEWLFRLNRHQWWVVLGQAYSKTNDERYAVAFVKQMQDWIVKNPPPVNKDERNAAWRLMEVGLRMGVSWIFAFATFSNSPNFTLEAKLTMLRCIYDHARFLALYTSKLNHLLRESNGLACVSIFFPEFSEAKLWQTIALQRLEGELKRQINSDGSHIELSTGYQCLVIDEFEKAYELLQIGNVKLENEDLGAWLEKMYQMLAGIIRPDGTFPEINDGFNIYSNKKLAYAGEIFQRDDFIFIGTGGASGAEPTTTSIAFNNADLYVMRSDWSTDARYLFFDAAPYGGFHGHEDKLSIEVFAYGQSFIVDSGSYTYEKTDPYRNYFVGSQAHNTVLVDNLSQIRRVQKTHRNPHLTKGSLATWASETHFDYAAASYDDGYGVLDLSKPKKTRINKDVTHTRRIVFIKPDYWVMVDELHASKKHDYQWLFHTPPQVKIHPGPNKRAILTTESNEACLHVIPADPHAINMSCVNGEEDPIQGWFSIDHLQKTSSATLVYEKKNVASVTQVTLLYPSDIESTCDDVSIESLPLPTGNNIAFKISSPSGTDFLMFSDDYSQKIFGPYKSDGIFAGVRTDETGAILKTMRVSDDNIRVIQQP